VYPANEPPIPPADEPPDVVVILFGANDLRIADFYSPPGGCQETACGAAGVARRLAFLGDTFAQSGATVLIGTPLMPPPGSTAEHLSDPSCAAGTPAPTQDQIDACQAAYRLDITQYWDNSRVLRREIRRQWRGRRISFRTPHVSYLGDQVHPSVPKGTDWMTKKAIKYVSHALRRRGLE
jgi:hypothetical protein